MRLKGTLRKMLTEFKEPVRYYLTLGDSFVDMNQAIGSRFSIAHVGNCCRSCGLDKPIFRMGFCSACFYMSPEASPSIINPELSMAHLGKADRDLEWEMKFQLQPHVVYLALSGGLKVGVTRTTQIPTRWIDQGASSAVIFANTENRYEAGQIEVLLKDNLPDKTNWQRMLKNQEDSFDLVQMKAKVKPRLSADFEGMYCCEDEIWNFVYPVEEYPAKIKSLSLDKQKNFSGILKGIRGQYLYFENGLVFNVRGHEGYVVELDVD